RFVVPPSGGLRGYRLKAELRTGNSGSLRAREMPSLATKAALKTIGAVGPEPAPGWEVTHAGHCATAAAPAAAWGTFRTCRREAQRAPRPTTPTGVVLPGLPMEDCRLKKGLPCDAGAPLLDSLLQSAICNLPGAAFCPLAASQSTAKRNWQNA